MNKLYFGDNLQIMREMEAGHIDLICTDPPFNSGHNYNAFFPESKAQEKAFTDIWQWNNEAIETREDIRERADADNTYQALNMCLEGYDLVLQKSVSGNKGAMRAYLAFIGPRLAEMHRLLKDIGSIYLHCDPTASHYIKGIMDAIFDQGNRKKNEHFRNEIVWSYQRWTGATKHFQRMHDIILFYGQDGKLTKFNTLTEPYSEKSKHKGKRHTTFQDDGGIEQTYTSDTSREKAMRDVWEISYLNSQSKERLGYPTQKPRALYERMIKASSNEGDLVMDPFCGCGTTIDAAHTLKRNWIGIDLTIIALDPISKRMGDRHTNSADKPLQAHKDYEIIGYPINMQEVHKLIQNEKKWHDFANWAVTRLGMIPTQDTGDGGKDGIGQVMLFNPETQKETTKRIISEVKTGRITPEQVRAFSYTIKEQKAIAGIFITLGRITDGMEQIAEDLGTFTLPNLKNPYPKLQFWRITDEYFDNPNYLRDNIKLPYNWIIPRKKSERHFENQQIQLPLP